jgi:lipopolysaccharide export system protein LptC
LIADAVAAAADRTDRILAQSIEGRMDISDVEFMTVQARLGDIDMAGQLATLSDGVTLQSSQGYQLVSERVLMALDTFDLRAPTPIHITGPGLDLTANTMHMSGSDGETIVRFNGSVRVLYTPQS